MARKPLDGRNSVTAPCERTRGCATLGLELAFTDETKLDVNYRIADFEQLQNLLRRQPATTGDAPRTSALVAL